MDNLIKKTAILTSKKNFSWQSMQEIIPFIENIWLASAGDNHIVELIDIDEVTIIKNTKKLMNFDNIVMTCFTVEMAIGVSTIRSQLNLKFRLFFYVHGMAPICFWPLSKWRLGKNLHSEDCLIVTCEGDRKLVKYAYPKIDILKHPFLNERNFNVKNSDKIEELVFIGRISEQKNLHGLFVAISVLKKELENLGVKLVIFGGEDGLGSPNQGKKSSNYLEYLTSLKEELEISELIEFRGFVNRETIDNYLAKNNAAFIAPALHCDENFGMSPYNILKNGGQCILSDWGGFAEYKTSFKEQVTLVEIYSSKIGPIIRIESIVSAIREALSKHQITIINHDTIEYYSKTNLAKRIREKATTNFSTTKPSPPSSLQADLLRKREEFVASGNTGDKNFGSQIFENYQDEIGHIFLNNYAREIQETEKNKEFLPNNFELCPWVSYTEKEIFVDDPRTGTLKFKRDLKQIDLAEHELKNLYELGQLFFLD